MKADLHWKSVRETAETVAAGEPALFPVLEKGVLQARSLEECLSRLLSQKLIIINNQENYLERVFLDAFEKDPTIGEAIRCDLSAVCERDPACTDLLTPLLYFKGFQALTAYRMAHFLWKNERVALALHLQSLISQIYSVDIHPAAVFGKGILLDHATSFVAGETTIVEDDVSILHEVTLGGTGKDRGLRHPYIQSGVLIGAGAKILGRITVGKCAKIGANSVVLSDVPEHTSVAGVPAKVVGKASEVTPALGMNHSIL